MTVEPLAIPEVKLVTPRIFADDRGFFQQTYHYEQYRDAGIDARFVQDNWSRSTKDVMRGLHYQLKHAQDKLVSVIRGKIFDVAVDIRYASPTFGMWVGVILSEANHHQLFVPKGFAHGFCVLSEEADLVYKCSDFYAQGDEYGIRWNDPEIGISWPEQNVLVSDKDRIAPFLKNVPVGALPVYQTE